jgi:CxxC motif-containing protein (DUF1111 family)
MRTLKVVTLMCFVFGLCSLIFLTELAPVIGQGGITDAPAAFDDQTNGFVTQAVRDIAKEDFNEREEIDEGLGPVYNARSCGECHDNPVSGGGSQITELRAGRFVRGNFIEHPGGSLVHSRAIDARIQELLVGGNDVRAFRSSLGTLGDGFVEAIDSNTLLAIYNAQPASMRAQLIQVPVLEAPGNLRAGRFGWKNQHASLISFSADAYLNEMGITSPLQATENTSNGNSVAAFDEVPDPEDTPVAGSPNGEGVHNFATFMRSSKAPPRDTALAATADAVAGSALFDAVGCNICHVREIVTAPPGTVINGGAFTIPAALGNKRIRPFSDFGLHDVGTGDGIVQNGGPSTRNKLRTPPLWGLRTRDRLMHDTLSLTRNEAILRHAGEATGVINNYRNLSVANKNRLIVFLNSL